MGGLPDSLTPGREYDGGYSGLFVRRSFTILLNLKPAELPRARSSPTVGFKRWMRKNSHLPRWRFRYKSGERPESLKLEV